jgi:hypothetical protein
MQNYFDVLAANFKKIADALGKNWKYTYHNSELPHEDDYMDSETISFNLNGEDLLLSFHHSDPDNLWIYAGLLMISFGPVEHIHFFTEEPKVVIESFTENHVSFIEIFSDGKFHQYQNFPKETYRRDLHL